MIVSLHKDICRQVRHLGYFAKAVKKTARMGDFIIEIFSYTFMQRAFVVTTVLSASDTPVGTFLVLRRLPLAGEVMTHAITPGVVIGFVIAGLSVTSLFFVYWLQELVLEFSPHILRAIRSCAVTRAWHRFI